MKSIIQKEPMGCGIACVAMALNKSYQSAKRLFKNPKYASTRGYYCKEIVKALNQKKELYTFSKINDKNKYLVKKKGFIVFIKIKLGK